MAKYDIFLYGKEIQENGKAGGEQYLIKTLFNVEAATDADAKRIGQENAANLNGGGDVKITTVEVTPHLQNEPTGFEKELLDAAASVYSIRDAVRGLKELFDTVPVLGVGAHDELYNEIVRPFDDLINALTVYADSATRAAEALNKN